MKKKLILYLMAGLLFSATPAPAPTIKPEVKTRLLLYLSKVNDLSLQIATLTRERDQAQTKLQAAINEARGPENCNGGEPVYGSGPQEGDLVCQPKEAAKKQ